MLREADAIGAIDVDADLAKPAVKLDIVVDFPRDHGDVDHDVRALVSDAIVRSGGMVTNLLPLGEEAQLKPSRNAWAGLRTPKWTAHTFVVEEVAGER